MSEQRVLLRWWQMAFLAIFGAAMFAVEGAALFGIAARVFGSPDWRGWASFGAMCGAAGMLVIILDDLGQPKS